MREVADQAQKRIITIHYAEIALKGSNRRQYEKALIKNAGSMLNESIKITRRPGRLLIYLDEAEGQAAEKIVSRLKKVFGIKWIGLGCSIPKDAEQLKKTVLEVARQQLAPDTRFRVKATRVDKTYPQTSIEIERDIGAAIVSETGASVDLKNPEKTIYISVLPSEILVVWERHEGPGGLPVGTSGRVVSLFSGGIDSPVASWLMMKRGCIVDLLHFYALPDVSHVRTSKIADLFEVLRSYSPDSRLYLASFIPFMKATINAVPELELALFRRFMLRVAEELARSLGALGIVTGDSVGQVASQTLENLYSSSAGIALPIYRPLIGLDKEEIVEIAKRVGTYEVSIRDYKDCCSILLRRAATRTRPEEVMKEWSRLGLDAAVEETLKSLEEL
jgi:thiamine biosynthesis protein ThiI